LAAINAFRVYGAKFVGISTDHEGMDTHELEQTLRKLAAEGVKPKFVYMVPTCQNPGGFTMSMERRRHFMELMEQYDLLVVEDDPYSYFTFEKIEYEHLKNIDRNNRVLYVGTLSKILAPGLRIGWALGPKELISQLELAKQTLDLHTSTLTQYIAMEAIEKGVVGNTIEKARELYRLKRDKMIEALEKYFPSHARWTKPVGGMFVFVYLREDIDTKALMYKALDHGVAYVPGQSFFVDGSGKNTMRLNYSFPSPEQIEEGIRRLGRMLSQL
ncbi:MAG: PLP-dependent aminotransferase family protein, partial [Desulfurococcales archaeon]|nr:PLP-dependent aminotransferase family protein [Desulfurococcales archaeon]